MYLPRSRLSSTQAAATTAMRLILSTSCGRTRTTCAIRTPAVAVRVYEDYRARTGDETPTVIASTASPFKFCRSVIEALGGTLENDDVTQLEVLSQLTGCTGTRSACRSGRQDARALIAW